MVLYEMTFGQNLSKFAFDPFETLARQILLDHDLKAHAWVQEAA